MNTRITQLFQIKYPIIQGGMVWCSGWKLASAVSNAGGLGLIGSGSMTPDLLVEHIRKCKQATNRPFGVNIPLIFKYADEHIQVVIREGVSVVFTSAGNPLRWTSLLKKHGIKVAHVVANTKGAQKCIEADVDAIVAEGFEAGGHNGREETTTMVLIPLIRSYTDLPLIAAGGIASGKSMLAAMSLGADAVQIGSLFAASIESSAHPFFKQKIIEAKEGDTKVLLKRIVPVRMLTNTFAKKVDEMELQAVSVEQLTEFIGKGRAKLGMFDGDIENGELEIGQASALINEILPVEKIISSIINEFYEQFDRLKAILGN